MADRTATPWGSDAGVFSAGSGPPAAGGMSGTPVLARPAIAGTDALLLRDDGTSIAPRTPEAWDDWVSAGRTRNHCLDDPILDWLERYGSAHGFQRDDESEGYDHRTAYLKFMLERGEAFDDGVVRLIRDRVDDDASAPNRPRPGDA